MFASSTKAASLLSTKTQLNLNPSGNFVIRPVVYSCVVGNSGSNKSNTQAHILEPITKVLQGEEHAAYTMKLRAYEQAKTEWKKGDNLPEKPEERHYWTNDATPEATVAIQAAQPLKGFLNYIDELSTLWEERGKYTGGKSTAKQASMTGKDGGAAKINRASGNNKYVESFRRSVTGSTQPDTIRRIMGDHLDSTGEFARYVFCLLPVEIINVDLNDTTPYTLKGLLLDLYRALDSQDAAEYLLSDDAKAIWTEYHNKLQLLKVSEFQPGFANVYSKADKETANFALILHCIKQAFLGKTKHPNSPLKNWELSQEIKDNVGVDDTLDLYISGETMAEAVKLSEFYIGQYHLLYTENKALEGDLGSQADKLIEFSHKSKNDGWIKPSEVARDVRAFKGLKTDEIKTLFKTLTSQGMGEIKGTDYQMQWRAVTQL